LDEDTKSAVILTDEHGDRYIGFIISLHLGYAKLSYSDNFGILHEEYFDNDDYEILEEWTQE
jgi:hypothetical protein